MGQPLRRVSAAGNTTGMRAQLRGQMQDRPTVILTRPAGASRRFSAELGIMLNGRAQIMIAPVMEIVPEPEQGSYAAFKTLIFTSAEGVDALKDPRALAGRLAYCVGDKTADAARAAGFRAISVAGDARKLYDRMVQDRPIQPWLHLSGSHQRVDLTGRFRDAGFSAERRVVYRQEARPIGDLAMRALQRADVILPVFSPRSAKLLSEMLPNDAPPPSVVAISQAAADGWSAHKRAMRVALNPDADSMARAILAAIEEDSAC